MVTKSIKEGENYTHDKNVMLRYAQNYAKKNGTKSLKSDDIEDILTVIIAIGQALLSKNPRAVARALVELGHLIKKYGAPLVAKLYHNFRQRQRRRAQAGEKVNVPPTEQRLQKFLAEHSAVADQRAHLTVQQLFGAKKGIRGTRFVIKNRERSVA